MPQRESYTDLLIIGAGPAGLMAACWASQYGNMSARIIDEKCARTPTGHADGLHSRTLEIFESFGFVDPIRRQAVDDIEMCYWNQNKQTGGIERTKRLQLQPDNLSRFKQSLLNQGRIEQVLIEYLDSMGRVGVERKMRAETLEVLDTDTSEEFPVVVGVKDLNGNVENGDSGKLETIRARYVVASDGAHSWTRNQLQAPTEARSDHSTWGVIDIIPITDFPDIRQSCAIQSEDCGNIMIAPREKRLVRLYIQIQETGELQSNVMSQSQSSPHALVKIAARTLKPYSLTYKHCDWWSLYPIKQRLTKQYRVHERVFLAGDAAHTHSPKGGQGMNVSMQDTYNLVWKLASVITRIADPDILDTYNSERQPVAEELLEMDRRLVQAYQEGDGASDAVEHVRQQYAGFMSGVQITYPPNVLVSSPNECSADTSLAKHITLGMRIPSFPVTRQADAACIPLADTLASDGAWRLIVFAGNLQQPETMKRLDDFAGAFSKLSHLSPVLTNGSPVVGTILVHSSPRVSVNLCDVPDVFRPFDEAAGYDYWRIFADDGGFGTEPGLAYKGYGIQESSGCLVLCRPDQHVAWIGGLEKVEALDDFFERVVPK